MLLSLLSFKYVNIFSLCFVLYLFFNYLHLLYSILNLKLSLILSHW